MSWLAGLTGQEPPRYVPPPDELKVKDPSIPDRMVSNKTANQPFLAHKEYRDRQERLHNEWLEKKKIRDAKIAKGEPVGPLERDPTEPREVGILGLLKFILYVTIFIALAGKFVTGSYTWEYETRLMPTLKSLWPTDQRLFSENALAEFNGEVPGRPTYLAIDGDVYDVSKGKAYQPGGSYHFMSVSSSLPAVDSADHRWCFFCYFRAGRDAARAFGTGCFQTHRTHDLRGLSDKEYEGVQHWKKFFADHKDYYKVGRVSHPPIDPSSPIPEHCDAKKQAQAEQEAAKRKAAQRESAQKSKVDL
ncbi:Sterol metabolism-related protein [Mycena sanguinolenta]|uniref:Sterol metabolism-related protein n=1 Tax=Mycena sanguinolenta TaxID=230812 RepID=A0A8H6Y985_9AGAR|nr:Sterol metabolism-related protein [Mycena sanguinolenta]